jgi:hypothetical protein
MDTDGTWRCRKERFYVQLEGNIFWVSLYKSSSIDGSGQVSVRWAIWSYDGCTTLQVPAILQPHYDQVLQDFKNALIAYGEQGMFSRHNDVVSTLYF